MELVRRAIRDQITQRNIGYMLQVMERIGLAYDNVIAAVKAPQCEFWRRASIFCQ
jgi:hypothetical protein